MTETNPETMARIQAEQDALQALREDVQRTIPPHEWQALIDFTQYCAPKLALMLEFYRHETGTAAYRLRPMTTAEQSERATDPIEKAP